MSSKMSLLGTSHQRFQDFEQKLNCPPQFTLNPILYADPARERYSRQHFEHADQPLRNYYETPGKQTAHKPKAVDPRLHYNSTTSKSNSLTHAHQNKNQQISHQYFGQGKAKTELNTRLEDQDKNNRFTIPSDSRSANFIQQVISKNSVYEQDYQKKYVKKKLSQKGKNHYSRKEQYDERYYPHENTPPPFYDPNYQYWYGKQLWNQSRSQSYPMFPDSHRQTGALKQQFWPPQIQQKQTEIKQQNKLNPSHHLNISLRKNTMKLRNIKNQIGKYKNSFCEQEWDRLLFCVHQLILDRNSGVKGLWAFMDSFRGSQRLCKGERIFDILSTLECQDVFDKLKEQQSIQKNRAKIKASEIKKILIKLVRKIS